MTKAESLLSRRGRGLNHFRRRFGVRIMLRDILGAFVPLLHEAEVSILMRLLDLLPVLSDSSPQRPNTIRVGRSHPRIVQGPKAGIHRPKYRCQQGFVDAQYQVQVIPSSHRHPHRAGEGALCPSAWCQEGRKRGTQSKIPPLVHIVYPG